jgi:ligand-binding sensor domain-containing protein
MLRILACLISMMLCALPARAFDRDLWESYPTMNYVTGLAESNEAIYVATTGGIRRYDRFAQRWLAPLTRLDGLPDNQVQTLVFDPDMRELWFNTPAGSGRWLEGLQTIMSGGIPPGQGVLPRKLSYMPPLVPPFGYYVEPNRIIGPRSDYAVTGSLIDSWRTLWIGTWGLGVGQANLTDQQLHFDTFGPLVENVTAMAFDGPDLWMGGADTYREPARGMTRYNRQTRTWTYFEPVNIIGLENAQVVTILADSTTVWFGTAAGLTRYDKRSKRWVSYRDTARWGRINALTQDGPVLWMGSDRGLALLDTRKDSLDRVSGSEQAVIRAMAGGPEFIWAGTESGLYRCVRGTRKWRPVSDAQKLCKRPIRALTVSDSTLWATTEYPSALLRHRVGTDVWQEFTLPDLSATSYAGIAVAPGQVWVSTDNGAFMLDVPRNIWTRYHAADGLISGKVQAVLADTDDIWFGTAQGLSRFRRSSAFPK